MSSIADIVISFVELLEAELGQARRALFRLSLGLGVLLICGLLTVGALAILLFAWFVFLSGHIGEAPAAVVTAVMMFAGAGGLLWLAKNLATK